MLDNNHNFLDYTKLSKQDAKLFMEANLYVDLDKARSRLLNLNKVEYYSKARNLTNYENTKTRVKHLGIINSHIKYALELIGEYSNERFGLTALEQDRFFHRPLESEAFFVHLYRAIQIHKQQQIIKTNKLAAEEMPKSMISEWSSTLRKFETNKVPYFLFNGKEVKEIQLYAAGVFYMTNFLFRDCKEQNNKGFMPSRSRELVDKFEGGILYKQIDNVRGGKSSGEARNKDKELGYKIFCENNILDNARHAGTGTLNNEVIAIYLCEALMEVGINKSLDTLKTHWVPDFRDRYEKDVSVPAT